MTTTVIDCDFDSQANNVGTQDETGASVQVSITAALAEANRAQFRFPLGAITDTDSVSDSSLQANCTVTNAEAGEGVTVRPYNDTGDDDPDADDAATKHSRSGNGTSWTVTIDCDVTGSKTAGLGTTADGQIQGNLSSPDFYSIAFSTWNLDGSEVSTLESIEAPGTDPATLTVVHAAAGGATLALRTLMGAGF